MTSPIVVCHKDEGKGEGKNDGKGVPVYSDLVTKAISNNVSLLSSGLSPRQY